MVLVKKVSAPWKPVHSYSYILIFTAAIEAKIYDVDVTKFKCFLLVFLLKCLCF